MRLTLLPFLYLVGSLFLFGQNDCNPGELSVEFELQTDTWGYESGWEIRDNNGLILAGAAVGSLANDTLYTHQVCVPDDGCLTFEIVDSYGDGLSNSGYFTLTIDGELILDNPQFRRSYSHNFACSIGQICELAIPVTEGIYATTYDNHWYSFTPDSVGTYSISTCGFTDCDTKIWVYDTCEGIGLPEDNQGITFFDDNDSECTPQAQVEGYFAPGTTYYIRIGDNEDACPDTLQWSLTYLGPVMGCTDITSCNYNPLATIDDGSCLPQGDPDCPPGPDLELSQTVLANTLYLTTIENNDPCLIEEGCVSGYGTRDVLRFETRIDNIGATDYFIGEPNNESGQFTWDNCHNHFHYDGYAEYLLFDSEGTQLPSSFKNGFCVIDLGCDTGSEQYSCNYMGITAGCYDSYWAGLECQWIDLTDVPDGYYHFVTRVNWDNAPDALGRVESDTLNNWAQVCITIDRSNDSLQVDIEPNCRPFVDCNGQLYGNAQPDCNGICGGSALYGDINADEQQDMSDAENYNQTIIAGDYSATACLDLNGDNDLTVYDAALLANCLQYGRSHVHEGVTIHDHCELPGGIVNPTDTVTFTITDIDTELGYLDIGISNPSCQVVGYQFQLEGISVSRVENLVPMERYPIAPIAGLLNNMVIGMSYQDSTIERSAEYQQLCRVYFSEILSGNICIAAVQEAVNSLYEQTTTLIENGCVQVVDVETVVYDNTTQLSPNPFQETATLSFSNPGGGQLSLKIRDSWGRTVRHYSRITGTSVQIERGELTPGMYFYELNGRDTRASGKCIIQ